MYRTTYKESLLYIFKSRFWRSQFFNNKKNLNKLGNFEITNLTPRTGDYQICINTY